MRVVAKIVAVTLILAGLATGGCLVMFLPAAKADAETVEIFGFFGGAALALVLAGLWVFRALGKERRRDAGEIE